MGIKRCPYCRALIEEGEMYCRNCGTQLLFPEDEEIEEDMPGEKIFLEEEEEEVETEEEIAESEEEEEEELERQEESGWEELEEDSGEKRETEGQEEEAKFEEGVDEQWGEEQAPEEIEIEAAKEETIKEEALEEEMEIKPGRRSQQRPEKERTLGEAEPEISPPPEIREEASPEEETEEIEVSEAPQESFESSLEELRRTLDFSTEELDRLTRSVDEARQEVEEFLLSLKEKAEIKKGEKKTREDTETEKEAEAETEKEAETEMEEGIDTGSETEEREKQEAELTTRAEGDLPPWAEAIRDRVEGEPGAWADLSPVTPQGFSFEKEGKVETEGVSQAEPEDSGTLTSAEEKKPSWKVDSGVGLPEKPGQQPLPFDLERQEEPMPWEEEEAGVRRGRPTGERRKEVIRQGREEGREAEEETGEEPESEEELTEAQAPERTVSLPSRSFKTWLKAKIFDLIFVGLFWLVAFVLAARLIAWPFFSLVAACLPQAIALFLILLVGYIFLFRFFIGETLGDQLFSAKD